MQIFNYHFMPRLIPTLATLVVLPILISLGMWQSGKADKKQLLQEIYESRSQSDPVNIGAVPINVEKLRYSKVVVKGVYEPAFQILLDNQVHNGRVGYYVITPLHIVGTQMRILVNRGWVAAGYDRNILPVIETPLNEVAVVGTANDLSGRFIELKQVPISKDTWQIVWQNLDIARYRAVVPFETQPVTILLDPLSTAGGYVREWPKPDSKIEVNRGYAVQWYLMSIALIVIYLVTNIKKVSSEGSENAK